MSRFFIIILLSALVIGTEVKAAMTSTNYQIPFDSINSGGTDFTSSTNYNLNDTLGEQAVGMGTSTNFQLNSGYRQADEVQSITLNVGAQENLTEVSYTALSLASKTVTVSDASSFSVGSRIGVVEDRGLTQSFIVGQVTQVNGLILTVDNWDGMTGVISESPVGGNDFVYRMDGSDVQFGTLTYVVGVNRIVQTEVVTNASGGYTLQSYSDGYLRDTDLIIAEVSDGSVSGDIEEYGAQVYGSKAAGTGTDFAVSTTHRTVQSSATSATADRIGMAYKINIISATYPGSYSQTVTYLLTANF